MLGHTMNPSSYQRTKEIRAEGLITYNQGVNLPKLTKPHGIGSNKLYGFKEKIQLVAHPR